MSASGIDKPEDMTQEDWDLVKPIVDVKADNFRLRQAIGKHRERIMSLGLGKDGHGTEWDRELWSALYDRVTTQAAEPPPKADQ